MSNRRTGARSRSCSFFVPVFGLTLANDIGSEIRIGRVTFVSAAKITRARKRLGIPERVSSYRLLEGPGHERLFQQSATYAHIRSSRSLDSRDYSSELKLVQEALRLLAASLIGRVPRTVVHFGIHRFSGVPIQNVLLFDNHSADYRLSSSVTAAGMRWAFSKRWTEYARNSGFTTLYGLTERRTQVPASWRQSIYRALLFAGKSQLALNRQDAFMNGMIAIETVLAQRNDRFPDALMDRLKALFGWLDHDTAVDWDRVIPHLYDLRCAYVHDAESKHISARDLFHVDTILHNVFLNIGTNLDFFSAKQALIEFAKQVAARELLGLKRASKRPKLRFVSTRADATQIEEWGDDTLWG